jgi:hypothetical protein
MKWRLLKGLSCAASVTFVLSLVNIAAASTMYLQGGGPDGIISIEAENYKAKEAIEGHYWELTTEKAGFSGKGAMVALPDDGANEDMDYDDSPFIDYQVNFVRTGRHYIWIRGWGVDDGDTGHLDLDHRELDNGEEIGFEEDRWNWAHESDEDDYAYFDIETPGLHTISLCMREDGLIVDKIVLTTNKAYRPQGVGPAESTGGGVMSFAVSQMSSLETKKEVSIPVSLISSGKGSFSVDYAVVGGTAGTKDYKLKSGTLTFKAGEKLKTIRLRIVQDGLDEEDETVVIKLSNPKGKDAQLGFADTFTYTIIDPRPVVEFVASSSGVTKQEGAVDVSVKLTSAYDKAVSADISIEGGSAEKVVFKPGQTEQNFKVGVAKLMSGKLRVALTNTVNAKLGENISHTVHICERQYSNLGGAFYFRYASGQRWEKYAKVGKYPDAMVRIGDGDDRLVFWRGSSYLPFLDTAGGKSFAEVVVPQNGDGEGLNFDRMCKHSHIRIVENSDARVLVEWRYIPDFDKSELEDWTEEYFTVYPDGACYRSIKTGTKTLEEYQDPSHAVVRHLLLTKEGICPMPKSWVKPVAINLDSASLSKFNDLGFDRTKGHYALEAKSSGVSGMVSFKVASDVTNPAVFVKGWGDAGVKVSVDGKAFDGFKVGYAKKMDNDDLVLWLGKDFKAGSKVVIEPVGGSAPVVRRPIKDPYKTKIPPFPESSPDPGPFGAFYTTLKYWTEWDNPRRVGDYADVVVQFEDTIDRLIFWRGTTNVPHWVNDKNMWYENEFCERRGDDSGLDGLCEPMQDHDSKFSNVRIIHSTPARVLVHWRYSPVTLGGDIPFVDETGWGDCVDEYHYVYPDETGVRDTTLYTSTPNVFNEWHEAIPTMGPGQIPEDCLDMQAFSMANASGDAKVFNFEKGFPPDSEFVNGYNIILIGMKGKGKPFAVCESAGQWFDPISRPGDTRFNHYDDWPAWPKKYRRGDWERKPENQNYRDFCEFLPAHSSLMHLDWDNYEDNYDGPVIFLRKVLLNGMTHINDVKSLVPLTRYWENAPVIKVTGYGYSGAVFDKSQKAYHIERRVRTIESLVNRDDDKKPNEDARKAELEVFASEESPLVNPCFVINGWPADARAKLYINGKEVAEGKDFRQGIETNWGDWDTKSSLVVWARCSSAKTINFTIEQVK